MIKISRTSICNLFDGMRVSTKYGKQYIPKFHPAFTSLIVDNQWIALKAELNLALCLTKGHDMKTYGAVGE
jgi:hypothetical protein